MEYFDCTVNIEYTEDDMLRYHYVPIWTHAEKSLWDSCFEIFLTLHMFLVAFGRVVTRVMLQIYFYNPLKIYVRISLIVNVNTALAQKS